MQVIDCCQKKWWFFFLLPLPFDSLPPLVHLRVLASHSLFLSPFSGYSLWHDSSMTDSLSVSKRTAQAGKLLCHTRGYSRRVLWHLSRERELCLCEQCCSLRAKLHIYTHNMRVVSKVHSLHPIPESTPSHFLRSTLIYFWLSVPRLSTTPFINLVFLVSFWVENENLHNHMAYGCPPLLLPSIKNEIKKKIP